MQPYHGEVPKSLSRCCSTYVFGNKKLPRCCRIDNCKNLKCFLLNFLANYTMKLNKGTDYFFRFFYNLDR